VDLDDDGVDEDRPSSSGRFCHAAISSSTLSVIRETVSFETDAP
jgi:hypothetical protein